MTTQTTQRDVVLVVDDSPDALCVNLTLSQLILR
jgi:hypothetical protein